MFSESKSCLCNCVCNCVYEFYVKRKRLKLSWVRPSLKILCLVSDEVNKTWVSLPGQGSSLPRAVMWPGPTRVSFGTEREPGFEVAIIMVESPEKRVCIFNACVNYKNGRAQIRMKYELCCFDGWWTGKVGTKVFEVYADCFVDSAFWL